MTRRKLIVPPSLPRPQDTPKDAAGRYLPPTEIPAAPSGPLGAPYMENDLSIDLLMQRGLSAIDRLMRIIMMDISAGTPSRETVMNLKDVMGMLETLKKREAELLDEMSDEELEKAAGDGDTIE